MVKPGKINSLKDIESEKLRLRMEIMKKEENIHADYSHILDALSFRNLASTMINEISSTSSVLAKAFSFGKSIMTKRKKKKQDKLKEVTDGPRS